MVVRGCITDDQEEQDLITVFYYEEVFAFLAVCGMDDEGFYAEAGLPGAE